MNRLSIPSFLAALVTAVAFCGTLFAAAPPPGGIKWQTDLNAAHRLSQQTGKPMLFVFGADWCTWCKKLEKSTLTDKQLVAYINDNFIPIHIDADRDPKVVQILEADALPCAVILSPNADLLGRINGYKDVTGYKSALAATRQPAADIIPAAAIRR